MTLNTACTVVFLAFLLAIPVSSEEATLADAPFRLTLPAGDWHFESDTPVTISTNLDRIAYATNATELRTVVIREQLVGGTDRKLEQLAANMRSKLTNGNVSVTETKTTFVGQPAVLLAYEMKIGQGTLYTETILFVMQDAGWTISAIGPDDRKEDVKHILTFYSKK